MKKQEKIGMRARRKRAVDLVKKWAEGVLRAHEEPVRSGKKRGQLIGFGKTKHRASLLQVLYPALTTEEIARLAGTSGNLLRKWRTEPEFKRASRREVENLWKAIVNSWILEQEDKESKLEETPMKIEVKVHGLSGSSEWIYALPFLNGRVQKMASDFLRKKVKEGKTIYAGWLAELELDRTGDRDAYQRLRSHWVRTPEWLEAYTGMIAEQIDLLANTKVHMRWGEEKIKKWAETLKDTIFALVNDLAK